MKKNFTIICFAIFLLGCSKCILIRSEYYDITGKVYTTKPENEELVILTEKPQKPFQEIGFVKVMARWGTSKDAIDKELKRRAKEAGADALIDVEYGEDSSNALPLCGKLGTTKRNKSAMAKAIVFRSGAEKEVLATSEGKK